MPTFIGRDYILAVDSHDFPIPRPEFVVAYCPRQRTEQSVSM